MKLSLSFGRRTLPSLTFASAMLLAPFSGHADFPEAGIDAFDSHMSLTVEIDVPNLGSFPLMLDGPVAVTRNDPDGGNPCTVETQIISMSLTGDGGSLGPVEVTLNQDR